MTRVTSLGRKRKHVEANFNYQETELEDTDAGPLLEGEIDEPTAVTDVKGANFEEDGRSTDGQPAKKKRKRGPRKKAGGKMTTGTVDEGGDGDVNGEGMENDSKGASERRGKKRNPKSKTLRGRHPFATSTYFRTSI